MPLRDFERHSPVVAETAWVDPTAVVVGEVTIGPESSIWPMCVLRGDIQSIRVGERTNIQDGSVIHVTHRSRFSGGHGVTIGDDVTVGHKAVLHGCSVEDRCLIGMGTTVMDGALVRSGAMIGAGSLVPPGREVEGGYLWLGSPARRVRRLTSDEREYLSYSAAHYVRLMRRHAEADAR
jgi:carbonic anhydrase/acetyltransferase-like protein (isoleucine patch superfamily)